MSSTVASGLSTSRLLGKTVFITGASSGIGYACALEFARAGVGRLVLAARRLDRLTQLAAQCTVLNRNVAVLPVQLDIQRRESVLQCISSLPSTVDVLVNNAGLALGLDSIENVSEEDLDTVLNTNVKGLIYCTQAVLPAMKARNSGHIINISSISSMETYPGGGAYCASKHAVDALSGTLRMELASTGINVTSINPGMVETEFSLVRFAGDKSKAKKVYSGLSPLNAQDIAETVVFAASRNPNVQIGTMTVFPTHQASVLFLHREQSPSGSD